MNITFRTAGIAAASLCFVAAIASAAPSVAGENQVAQPAAVYTDHATATLTDVAGAGSARLPGAAAAKAAGVAVAVGAVKSILPGYVPVQAPQPVQTTLPLQPTPLEQLVAAFSDDQPMDPEKDCLARAVYFESRGEPLEGQLAVANVVLNRAASGHYPATLCGVVRQPAQFSFVRRGHIPAAPRDEAWHRAVAISHIATERFASGMTPNVLWYHADYVSPSWGRRLTRVAKIGAHVFYS